MGNAGFCPSTVPPRVRGKRFRGLSLRSLCLRLSVGAGAGRGLVSRPDRPLVPIVGERAFAGVASVPQVTQRVPHTLPLWN